MYKIDFSIIVTVRVPHQQFESIKNKAKYLIIQDKKNGDVLAYVRDDDDQNAELIRTDNVRDKCGSCKHLISCDLRLAKQCKYESRWQYDD